MVKIVISESKQVINLWVGEREAEALSLRCTIKNDRHIRATRLRKRREQRHDLLQSVGLLVLKSSCYESPRVRSMSETYPSRGLDVAQLKSC